MSRPPLAPAPQPAASWPQIYSSFPPLTRSHCISKPKTLNDPLAKYLLVIVPALIFACLSVTSPEPGVPVVILRKTGLPCVPDSGLAAPVAPALRILKKLLPPQILSVNEYKNNSAATSSALSHLSDMNLGTLVGFVQPFRV